MCLANIKAELQYRLNMCQIDPLSKMLESRSVSYQEVFIFVFWNILCSIIRYVGMKLKFKREANLHFICTL